MFSWNTVISAFKLFSWALTTYASPNQMPSALLSIDYRYNHENTYKVAKFIIVSLVTNSYSMWWDWYNTHI